MQQLHLVGFTTDHRGLIFSVRRNAKSGGYKINLDASLIAAVEELRALLVGEDTTEHKPTESRPQSALSVREVQARLRRGHTVEQVAHEAGVEPAWVARFAAPVLAEQAEVIRAARATKMIKARVGLSAATLGDAVYRNLADRGVTDAGDRLDKRWSARQLAEGSWMVTFRYPSRAGETEAAWEFDTSAGTLTARGRQGALLGYREPRRPPRIVAASRPAKKATAVKKATTAKKATMGNTPPASAKKTATRTTKRVAAARKAATARLAAEAQRATRRDAELVRQAAKRTVVIPPRRADPSPDPEPTADPDPLVDAGSVGDRSTEPEIRRVAPPAPDDGPGAERERRPRREPVRSPRSSNGSDKKRSTDAVARHAPARSTPGEPDDVAGDGAVFRTDLASQASFPMPSPATPLSIPQPIDRPPRRRRRSLRGR